MNSFLSQVVTSEDLCGCVWRYLPVKLKTKSTSQKQVQGKSSIFHCEQSQLSQPNRNQPSGKAFTVGSLWAASPLHHPRAVRWSQAASRVAALPKWLQMRTVGTCKSGPRFSSGPKTY